MTEGNILDPGVTTMNDRWAQTSELIIHVFEWI